MNLRISELFRIMFNPSVLTDITFTVFILSFVFILISVHFDSNKKKKITKKPFISFIMSAYNDADSIEEAIKSIYKSYDNKHFELIIINDSSTDNTIKIVNGLKKKYPLKIINNKKNIGKAYSINNAFKISKGEIIFIVDSDTQISKKAVDDILIRLENEKVGGVSCRYIPLNNGFLAAMQKVEYGMINLVDRSCNFFSTIGFWGGCVAVKREVFVKVGLLSTNTLTEDLDLALKIGEVGYKSQESSVPVYSYVPDNFSTWYKQKKRWSAGWMQNIINHFSYFRRHPVAIFFFITYSLLALSFVIGLTNNIAVTKNFYILFESFRSLGYSFINSIGLAKIGSGIQFLKFLGLYLLYPLFSIPYVAVNYSIKKNPYSLLLIFPFSIIYIPVYTAVCIIGFSKGIYKAITLKKNIRGW